MEIYEIIGYAGALLIGIILGLIGGGGSILTVPVLVYAIGLNPVIATAYSLFIVGTSSLIGALGKIKKKLVDFRTAIVFAIPSFIAVYITRRYIVPAIPENIFIIGNFEVTKNIGIMVFFAIIMLMASISMIWSKKKTEEQEKTIQYNYMAIILEGLVVGTLTGIVGAGGGFLIIPALVLLAKLPMKKAVGTSLLIIAFKSLIGFIGDIQNLSINWNFLFIFTFISVVGIFIGNYLSKYISGNNLKKGFGWFTLIMSFYIIYKELF
ncbi:sulfite exporter TauE/SafE family protein [Leptobacterium sp. I13]|uniref:sulfite exporter TauE/SafE family protein n=1 Tax=Leptobacterium meishanense TaxID=3128904 RepID=UPI0030EE816F